MNDVIMKGLIVAAGYGSRFFPASKTVPKELFPLIEFDRVRPAISFILEEFYQAGLRDVIIITSRRKKSLEDYLDKEIELEHFLGIKKSESKLAKLREEYIDDMNFCFVRQKEMRGTAHAIYLAKPFTADETILVAYPDDIFISDPPLSKKLIEINQKTGKNVLTGLEVSQEEVSRFGIIEPGQKIDDDVYEVKGFVEKPSIDAAPSRIAGMARYLFTSEFFDEIEPLLEAKLDGEIYQTDGILKLAEKNKVVFYEYKGEYYDIGEPLGYLKTLTRYGLKNHAFSNEYRTFLKSLLSDK
ncbi:MAG: UTP--glucose-1-phosphate uridylyltransferase [Candidatus Hodarchaeales archaeon]